MSALQFYLDLVVAATRELLRFRFWMVSLFSLLLLAVLFVGVKWPQKYSSSAVLLVDVTNVIEPLLRGKAEVVDIDVNEKIGDVISSRNILEKAFLRLYPEASSFNPKKLENEVKRFSWGLDVSPDFPRKQTRVFYSAVDPTTAYESLSSIVQAFLDDRAEEKQKISSEAYRFIDSQVVVYKRQLEEAEQRLKEFKSHSIVASESDVHQRMGELGAEIKDLQVEIQEVQERVRSTQAQLVTERQFIEVRDRNNSLIERKKLLQDELDRLRLLYQDTYPDIVTIRRQLAEIDLEIQNNLGDTGLVSASEISDLPLYEELRKQLSSNEVQLLTKKRRLKALGQMLVDEGKVADQVAERQAELINLTRDYDVNKSAYEGMLGRKENARLTMVLNNEGQGINYRLIDGPTFPLNLSGIPPLIIFMAAPIVAILGPLLLVFAYVFLDPRYRSAVTLKNALPEGVQLLAKIPHQNTPLGQRLMRKDMLILALWVFCLMIVYVYLAYIQLIAVD